MTNKQLFDSVSLQASKSITQAYSTSFSLGIRLMSKKYHHPIYSIYGFVRLADEIVDSFHDYDKEMLLRSFREDTNRALEEGISLNPVLNSFQATVKKFNIEHDHIHTFLDSMEMDLRKNKYDQKGYQDYILGSAEVVGLMCLKVFCDGDENKFNALREKAMKLGSAFQKINFLRDLNADFNELGRSYFPDIDVKKMNAREKKKIEEDIEKDFHEGYLGIKMLPAGVKFGVYVAYVYYYSLFKKIKSMPPSVVLTERVRIPGQQKFMLLLQSYIRYSFNLL